MRGGPPMHREDALLPHPTGDGARAWAGGYAGTPVRGPRPQHAHHGAPLLQAAGAEGQLTLQCHTGYHIAAE